VEELLFGHRYRATERIGTGGMADVYKAVDEVLGRTVAVKVMHARLAADPSFAARFRQEAQAAANLMSPNIVNMYDWGQDDGTFYIVMARCRRARSRRSARKSARRCRSLMGTTSSTATSSHTTSWCSPMAR